MPKLTLLRFANFPEETFGCLSIEGAPLCFTLELEWQENRPNVSRIPAGTYLCKRVWSPKFRVWTFEIANVPGRSYIRFHWGTKEKDTLGCILLGDRADFSDRAVWESKIAFEGFMIQMEGINEFQLEIKEA